MPPLPESAQLDGNAEDTSRKLIIDTMDALRRMRYFRRQYDPRRAYWYRQYLGQRDQRLYPDNLTPRANTFVPYARSQVETVVGRIHDAFFSIDPPIEVRGRGDQDQAAAPFMQIVLLSMMHRCKWVSIIETLVRNICIYGHAGIKIDWDWDFDTVMAPDPVIAMQPMMDPVTGMPLLTQTGQQSFIPIINPMDGQPIQLGTRVQPKQIPRMRPKLIPIDVYDLLIDPDGGQIAHLMEEPLAAMLRKAQAKPDLYLPGAIEELEKKVKNATRDDKDPEATIIRQAEYWDETHNTVTLITFGEDAEAVSWKDLRYSYRNANYSAYKRKVYGGSPILLQYGPNPFIHKRPPILHTSYTKLTGEPYGVGVIEPISDLNESLNKFCNMITDNWDMGINKRFVYSTDVDIDHAALNQFNVPGGKVGVSGDASKALFPLPTMVPTPAEFGIMELYKQQIELSSGISDFYAKGVGSAGGNRTATGIGQVQTESNYIFKMFIRNLELDILQPMMEMCSSMIQQFCTDYVEYQITDSSPVIPKVGRIPIENVIGNFDFDFVAANYATNKVVRQRNMMAFYQIAQQTPYANQGEFLREIAKVMEIPNAARLVKPDQQVMQEQAQNQQQQLELGLLQKLLDAEHDMLKAEAGKAEPNSVTQHALAIQKIIEQMLQAGGDLAGPGPPEASPKEGRPATRQPEGKIPGSGITGMQRSMAQAGGANALGLGSMGEMGGGE